MSDETIENKDREQAGARPRRRCIWRRVWVTVVVAVAVVALLPGLLYIPPLQRALVDMVSERVSESTGYDVSIGYFRLKFPFKLAVGNVLVLDAGRDTMAAAGGLEIGIRLRPLFQGDIAVSRVRLTDVVYVMGNRDSAMYLSARLRRFDLQGSRVEPLASNIRLSAARLEGADVMMVVDARKATPEQPDTVSAQLPWRLELDRLSLSNVRFRMSMMPTIDSLDAIICKGGIDGVSVNLSNNMVRAGLLAVDSLHVAYLTPNPDDAEAFMAGMSVATAADTAVSVATASLPWTILADSIRVDNTSAVYAMNGSVPAEGFDPNFIDVTDVSIAIDSFYNRGSRITIPIRQITANERSGVGIRHFSGRLQMTDSLLSVSQLNIKTLLSEIKADARVENAFLAGNSRGKAMLEVHSSLSLEEAGKIVPSMRPLLRSISRVQNVEADLRLSGTAESLGIERLDVSVKNILNLKAGGKLTHVLEPDKLGGDMHLDGRLTGGRYLHAALGLDSALRIPVLQVAGQAGYDPSGARARLTATVDTGNVRLAGNWRMNGNHYEGNVSLDRFDVRSVMPFGSIGQVDGSLSLQGAGFDVNTLTAQVAAEVNRLEYDSVVYHGLALNAMLDKGRAHADLRSESEFADLQLNLEGKLSQQRYFARIRGAVNRADLRAMRFSDDVLDGHFNIRGLVRADVSRGLYAGLLRLSEIGINYGKHVFETDSIDFGFASDSLRTHLRMRNDDMLLRFHSQTGIMALADSLSAVAAIADSMLTVQRVDFVSLQRNLPRFTLDFNAGNDNIVHQYLTGTGVTLQTLDMKVRNTAELEAVADIENLQTGGVAVDTIHFYGKTRCDSLYYGMHVGNQKKNADLFMMADAGGYISGNTLLFKLLQKDKTGVTGFDTGIRVSIVDSVVRLSLFPEKPVIAFRDWTLNRDNYLSLDLRDLSLAADLELGSGENSHINIYTDERNLKHNGINLDLAGIELKDWLTLSPFSPPVRGRLDSKFHVFYNERSVWGDGAVNVDELSYGKRRIGDIGLTSRLAVVGESQKIFAQADMQIDGRKVLDVRGYQNDSLPVSRYDLNVSLLQLPLSAANAFLPQQLASLSGCLNGKLSVKGQADNPEIAGFVRFDTARVSMPMYGASLAFDTVPIVVAGGKVRFDHYAIFGANENPLEVNGTLSFLPMDKMYADLTLKGNTVQVVNGSKNSKSELYGKGYISIDALARGYMNELDVKAAVSVLPGTNLTYVVQSASAPGMTASSSDEGVVRFVEFSDTTHSAAVADSTAVQPFGMQINAVLSIMPSAQFTVNLSPNGSNRVQLDGDGTLNYNQTYQGDMSMTGRYVINTGYVRYTPPMLSEKLFNFESGSSVVWNGDVLNPSLDIRAVQSIKANVTSEGENSRVVPFDVSLNVGNTLEELDITFDLSTDGDMTIANELSGMTAEQRATQAMNLLLYNTYTGASSKASSNLSGNMLNSFLESQLNKWAASSIKGVDLSFGIDQYDKTVDGATSTTTSYSYQVSKSVFDDRFKIVVGGNYSTDASAQDNLSQNLVNDISFEYKINKAGTTYVKLFRHTEYESILEGEITETGGGFVWKRKITSWRDFFRFLRKKKDDMQPADEAMPDDRTAAEKQPAPESKKKGTEK